MKEPIVCLKDGARQRLQELVQSGTRSLRVVRRALILLKSDEGFTDEKIAEHTSRKALSRRMQLILAIIKPTRVR